MQIFHLFIHLFSNYLLSTYYVVGSGQEWHAQQTPSSLGELTDQSREKFQTSQ